VNKLDRRLLPLAVLVRSLEIKTSFLSNVLLTKENNAKLADVGISRLIKTDNENFLTTFVGTIPYMSPEIRKGRNYDYKTDIWYFFKE